MGLAALLLSAEKHAVVCSAPISEIRERALEKLQEVAVGDSKPTFRIEAAWRLDQAIGIENTRRFMPHISSFLSVGDTQNMNDRVSVFLIYQPAMGVVIKVYYLPKNPGISRPFCEYGDRWIVFGSMS